MADSFFPFFTKEQYVLNAYKIKTVFCVLFFSMGVTGSVLCQSAKIEKLKERIEENFVKQPDSAKVYLLRLLKHSDQLADSLLARVYNKLGVSYGQLTNVDSSRHYFKKGIAIVEEDAKLLGNIYKNWAQSERNMTNYNKAFEVLEHAEKYYLKADFQRGFAMVHTGRGTIYNYEAKGEKAIVELQKAIALFEKIGDERYLIFAQQELVNTYSMTENYEFAKDLYEEILPKMKMNINKVNYGDYLFHLDELQEAEDSYTTALNFFRENNHEKIYYLTLNKLANVSKNSGRMEEATSRFEEAFSGSLAIRSTRLIQIATDYLNILNELGRSQNALKVVRQVQHAGLDQFGFSDKSKIAFLKVAKRVFEKNGHYEQALGALDRASLLQDSISDVQKQIELKEIQAKYQNEYQGKENKILTKKNQLLYDKNRAQRTIIILVALLACTLIMVGVVIYKKKKQQAKLKAEALLNLERSKQNLEEKLKMEVTLYEERKKVLAHRKRELVASTLQIVNLHNGIKATIDESNNGATVNRLKQKLKLLLAQDRSWDLFIKKFMDVYPGFLEKLQADHPQLTLKDVEFCALIKLNLSNKEIGVILNIDHHSVITKKYRLRKKIGVSNENVSIEGWIAKY